MNNNTSDLFYSGRYQEICNINSNLAADTPFLIGSFVFTGRIAEAKALYKKSKLTQERNVESLFYLFLASVRTSEYQKMKTEFMKLFNYIRSIRHKKLYSFYLHQSLGIIRFYKGEYRSSISNAKSAFEISLQLNHPYLTMISSDLMGNSLCMQAKYGQGFEAFKIALNYAKQIKNNKNSHIIELSKLSYEISAGKNLPSAQRRLEKWIAEIEVQDYFSKTNAQLQRAQLYLYAGQLGKMENTLKDISQDVFAFGHRRQILEYNLSSAKLSLLKGNKHAALNLIKTSYHLCLSGQDYNYKQQFLELEVCITNELNSELKRLEKITGRKKRNHSFIFFKGDISKNLRFDNLEKLSNQSFLGSLFDQKEFTCTNFINFSFEHRSALICINSNLKFSTNLSSNQLQLLKLLVTQRYWERSELFERHWGVSFDPYIHLNKLYVNLKRLQKQLGDDFKVFRFNKGIIETTPLHIEMGEKSEISSAISINTKLDNFDLNPRQMQFIQHIEKGQIITAREYSKKYGISRATTTRDLQTLANYRLLQQKGQKKGIFYIAT